MPEGEIRPPQNFVERIVPKSAERVPQLEVTKTALEIASFYRLPEGAIKKGMNTEVYLLPPKQLAEIALAEVNRTTGQSLTSEEYMKLRGVEIIKSEKEGSESPNIINPSLEEVLALGGICLPWDGDKSLIYINTQGLFSKKRVQRHELFHAMASNGPDVGFGFFSSDRVGSKLEESTIELLEIFQRAPQLAKGTLSNLQYVRGGEGDTESPYYMEMNTLGFILECAEWNNQPVSAQEIAGIRFDPTKTPDQRRQALKSMFSEKIGDNGEIPMDIFDKLAS